MGRVIFLFLVALWFSYSPISSLLMNIGVIEPFESPAISERLALNVALSIISLNTFIAGLSFLRKKEMTKNYAILQIVLSLPLLVFGFSIAVEGEMRLFIILTTMNIVGWIYIFFRKNTLSKSP